MFPDGWLETGLALLIVLAGAAWMKYFRSKNKTNDDEIVDYTNSGTDPGPPKAQSLPKGFGTAEDHPHHRD